MTAFSSELLRHLREHTRDQHRSIERQHLMRSLMAPRVCKRAYSAVLQALFHYYASLERMLVPSVNELLARFPQAEYLYVPRGPLLGQDLVDLDISAQPLRPGSETLPLPAMDTIGSTLGVLYVLEGSTQGGRIIAPRLGRTLGVGPTQGGRFFSLHTATNSGWLGFRELLNTLEMSSVIIEPAVVAASETFESLQSYLDAWSHQEGQRP